MSKVEYKVICFLIGLEALMLSALSLVKKRKAFRASAKPNDLSLEVKILLHWIEIDYCTMHINRCNPRLNFKSKSGLVLHAFRNI